MVAARIMEEAISHGQQNARTAGAGGRGRDYMPGMTMRPGPLLYSLLRSQGSIRYKSCKEFVDSSVPPAIRW